MQTLRSHSGTLAQPRVLALRPPLGPKLKEVGIATVRFVTVAVGLLALAACGGGKKTISADPPGGSVRVGAFIVAVPQGFTRRRVQASNSRVTGVVISDYRVKAHGPTLAEGIFPGNRVALAVGAESWTGASSAPPLRLPLTLDELQGPQHHADGTAWNGLFRFHGQLYPVSFWAGQSAPPRDRTALLHTLTSIHPAR